MFSEVYFTVGDFSEPSDKLRELIRRSSAVLLLSNPHSTAEHEGRMIDTPVIIAMRNIQFLLDTDFPDVSISPSIFLFIHLYSIYLSLYLSISLSIYLSVCLSSFYLPSLYLSIYPSFYSSHLSIHPSLRSHT